MKKYIFSILILFLISLFGYLFIGPKRAQAAEAHLNSCGVLSQANTTYILDSDVSSAGTCFQITNSGITLDLNGHTVTYNTEPANKTCILERDAQSHTGNYCVYGVETTTWWKTNIKVTNGKIIQGPGGSEEASPVSMFASTAVEVSYLNLTYYGNDTKGIKNPQPNYTTGGYNIHNNTITSNVTVVSNRQAGVPAIDIGGINPEVHDNVIAKTPHMGIRHGAGDNAKIYNNQIIVDSPGFSNPYAIIIQGAQINFDVYNNTINAVDGRGISIDGTPDNPGPGKVHDNHIDVKQSSMIEYGGVGNSHGIRLRFGTHDTEVYNNTIIGHAGNVCPSRNPNYVGSGCTVHGISVTAHQGGINNKFYNNDIIVSTNDPNLEAADISFGGNDLNAVPYTPALVTEIIGNRLASNHTNIEFAYGDGSADNQLLISNTFVKSSNPLNYHTITVGYWNSHALNETFTDTILEGGADLKDLRFPPTGSGDYSYYNKWFLNITVKGPNGQPIEGAIVTANASGTSLEPITATTDPQGKVKLALPEYYRYGTTVPATTNYNNFNPYNITASKSGLSEAKTQIIMDTSKALEMTLSQSVSLAKQVDKSSATTGETLTYTLSYSNPTPNTYTNARIEDLIPAGTTFISASNGGISDSTKVIWNLGNLSPQLIGTVSFQVKVQ